MHDAAIIENLERSCLSVKLRLDALLLLQTDCEVSQRPFLTAALAAFDDHVLVRVIQGRRLLHLTSLRHYLIKHLRIDLKHLGLVQVSQ